MKIDGGLGVEPFEFYVYHVHLLALVSSMAGIGGGSGVTSSLSESSFFRLLLPSEASGSSSGSFWVFRLGIACGMCNWGSILEVG
jgi:hypothetical protein